MRSFTEAYKASKESVKESRDAQLEIQRREILAAMKDTYEVEDFNLLNEEEKQLYRTLLLEYWNPESGTTKKGELLLRESKETLVPDSTDKQIETYFKKQISKNLNSCLRSLGRDTSAKKKNVESVIKQCNSLISPKKIEMSVYKQWACEQITAEIKKIFEK